jgi:hypothetical protein
LRPGRALHLIDIENLNQACAENYHAPASGWLRVVGINPHDLAVVGTDASGAFAAREALPTAGLVVGRGESGADRALTRRGAAGLSTSRFDTLIIGSGDGEFARIAQQARTAGLYVLVVSHRRSLSTRLAHVASRVLLLDASFFGTDGEGDDQ